MSPQSDPKPPSASASVIAELFTPARVEDLNVALTKRNVGIDRIVAIFQVPGHRIANAEGDQFRILYRAP